MPSRVLAVIVAFGGVLIAPLGAAQVPSPPAMAQPQPAAPAPPRPRTVQVMSLTTPAWTDGGAIPVKHSQAGRDVSPPLAWSNVPEGTGSFVLLVRDLDEIVLATGEPRIHWLVWNLPGTARSIAEGLPEGNDPDPPRGGGRPATPSSTRPRQISVTGPNYRGPAAPASGAPHHYVFELYALAAQVDVPAVGQSPNDTVKAVLTAATGQVLGKGTLVGTFRRPAP